MTDIEWTAPPAHGNKNRLFPPEVLDALRSRPGEWACVKRSHSNGASTSSFARSHPEFEATTRLQPDGTFDIYARFVGESK